MQGSWLPHPEGRWHQWWRGIWFDSFAKAVLKLLGGRNFFSKCLGGCHFSLGFLDAFVEFLTGVFTLRGGL